MSVNLELPVQAVIMRCLDNFYAEHGKQPEVVIAPAFMRWYLIQELRTPMQPNPQKITEFCGVPIFFSDFCGYELHAY